MGVAGVEQQHGVGGQRTGMVGHLRQGPLEAFSGSLSPAGAAQLDRLRNQTICIPGSTRTGLSREVHGIGGDSGWKQRMFWPTAP